jgi:hypothetical protein
MAMYNLCSNSPAICDRLPRCEVNIPLTIQPGDWLITKDNSQNPIRIKILKTEHFLHDPSATPLLFISEIKDGVSPVFHPMADAGAVTPGTVKLYVKTSRAPNSLIASSEIRLDAFRIKAGDSFFDDRALTPTSYKINELVYNMSFSEQEGRQYAIAFVTEIRPVITGQAERFPSPRSTPPPGSFYTLQAF